MTTSRAPSIIFPAGTTVDAERRRSSQASSSTRRSSLTSSRRGSATSILSWTGSAPPTHGGGCSCCSPQGSELSGQEPGLDNYSRRRSSVSSKGGSPFVIGCRRSMLWGRDTQEIKMRQLRPSKSMPIELDVIRTSPSSPIFDVYDAPLMFGPSVRERRSSFLRSLTMPVDCAEPEISSLGKVPSPQSLAIPTTLIRTPAGVFTAHDPMDAPKSSNLPRSGSGKQLTKTHSGVGEIRIGEFSNALMSMGGGSGRVEPGSVRFSHEPEALQPPPPIQELLPRLSAPTKAVTKDGGPPPR